MKKILAVIANLTLLFAVVPAYAGPTGNLRSLYGTPEQLQFLYTPGDTVSLAAGSAALASVTGSNSNATAFLEITNNADPFASNGQIYFQSAVQTGQTLFADATINPLTDQPVAPPNNTFGTAPGSEMFAFIFDTGTAFENHVSPIETMTYATSNGHGMSLGDTIGSLTLVGYVGTSGSFVSSAVPEPSSRALFAVGVFAIFFVSRRRRYPSSLSD